MGTVHELPYVNGGPPEQLKCHYCKYPLGNERAVANTPSGPRYFCLADPEHPLDSCYLQYRRRHH